MVNLYVVLQWCGFILFAVFIPETWERLPDQIGIPVWLIIGVIAFIVGGIGYRIETGKRKKKQSET